MLYERAANCACLYGLAWIESIEKLQNFSIHFHRSGMKTQNFLNDNYLLNHLSMTFFNAICILKVPGHFKNCKMPYCTACTVICDWLNDDLSLLDSDWLKYLHKKNSILVCVHINQATVALSVY